MNGSVGTKRTSVLKLYPASNFSGFMYIQKKGSSIAVALSEWHSSHESVNFFPFMYYEKELTKEYHSVLPKEGALCLKRDESSYYEVNF